MCSLNTEKEKDAWLNEWLILMKMFFFIQNKWLPQNILITVFVCFRSDFLETSLATSRHFEIPAKENILFSIFCVFILKFFYLYNQQNVKVGMYQRKSMRFDIKPLTCMKIRDWRFNAYFTWNLSRVHLTFWKFITDRSQGQMKKERSQGQRLQKICQGHQSESQQVIKWWQPRSLLQGTVIAFYYRKAYKILNMFKGLCEMFNPKNAEFAEME